MKVQMITTMAGPEGNASPGDIVSVKDKLGKDLIAGRYARPVDEPEPRRVEAADEKGARSGAGRGKRARG